MLQKSLELKEEVNSRGSKIMILSQKLTRTQHALGNLQKANDEYHSSAKKVVETERKLLKKKASLVLSSKESKSLRHELDAATSMMNAACERVEQIEAITDALIKQLSETEAELAELQDVRSSELVKHSAEVEKLAHERDYLALQLAASNKAVDAMKIKDAELSAKLEKSTDEAHMLSEELQKAGRIRAETEESMKKQREKLTNAIKQLEVKQSSLSIQLENKEEELRQALILAKEGTPKGRGAKQVLPMALRRLKETQDELKKTQTDREEIIQAFETAKDVAKKREEELLSEMKKQADDASHCLDEKEASLQSMIQAAASAAQDAALKQEKISKLTTEINEMEDVKGSLLKDLQESKDTCAMVSAQLVDAKAFAAQHRERIAKISADINAAKVESLEKEIVFKTQIEEMSKSIDTLEQRKQDLSKQLLVAEEVKTKYASEIDQLNVVNKELQEKLALSAQEVQKIAAVLEKQKAASGETIQGLDAVIGEQEQKLQGAQEQVTSLNAQLKSITLSKNQISAALQEKELEVSRLTMTYEDSTKALKAVLAQKEQSLADVSSDSKQLAFKIESLTSEMESMQNSYALEAENNAEKIARLSGKLTSALAEIETLKTKYHELECQSAEKDAEAIELVSDLKVQLDIVSKCKATLEAEAEDKQRSHIIEIERIQHDFSNLQQSNNRLTESIHRLGEELAAKEEEVELAKAQGTPRGEASKEILKRALVKVKGLEESINVLESTIENKDADISDKKMMILNLEGSISEMKSYAESLNENLEIKIKQLAHSESNHERLCMEIRSLSNVLQAEVQQRSSVEEDNRKLKEQHEEEISAAQKRILKLEAQKAGAEEQGKALQMQLNETKEVLCSLRASEENSAEVIRLSFIKIRRLEESLQQKTDEIEQISSQLLHATAGAEELQQTLNDLQKNHELEKTKLNEKIASMEANISRLRLDLQDELSSRQALEDSIQVISEQKRKLQEVNRSLESRVDSLENALECAQKILMERDSRILSMENENSKTVRRLELELDSAAQEREIAENERETASSALAQVEKDLAAAKIDLDKYERSLDEKQNAIVVQQKEIEAANKSREELKQTLSQIQSELINRNDKIQKLQDTKNAIEKDLKEKIKV